MQEPEKPKEEGLKGLDLDKFGTATKDILRDLANREKASDDAAERLRGLTKKGLSFFKTAKAALQGDEASKQKITDGFSNAAIKASDALHQVEAVAKETQKKIAGKLEEREKQAKPPQP